MITTKLVFKDKHEVPLTIYDEANMPDVIKVGDAYFVWREAASAYCEASVATIYKQSPLVSDLESVAF